MIHIPQDLDSKYRFITLAAQRCDQLMRGAKPRLDSRSSKPTTIALEEILAGLVEVREGEGPWPEDEAMVIPAAPLEGVAVEAVVAPSLEEAAAALEAPAE